MRITANFVPTVDEGLRLRMFLLRIRPIDDAFIRDRAVRCREFGLANVSGVVIVFISGISDAGRWQKNLSEGRRHVSSLISFCLEPESSR